MQSQPYEDEVFYNVFGMRLWEQRHDQVVRILQKHQVYRVFDFGCSEGQLLRRISRGTDFTQLVGVDIDRRLIIEQTANNVEPELLQDSLKYRRQSPLKVEVYCGDILQPCQQMLNLMMGQPTPCAITLVEVIEHLRPSQLSSLNPALFLYYQPELVIVTTPNKDFNVYFGDKGTRHPDHQFEWSRSEFVEYCKGVAEEYSYQADTFGVGEHKNGSVEFGYCSQGAVFTRVGQRKSSRGIGDARMDKIVDYDYPFWRERIKQDIVNSVISELRRRTYQASSESQLWFALQDLVSEALYKLLCKGELVSSAYVWLSSSQKLQVSHDVIRLKECDQEEYSSSSSDLE